MAIFGMTVSVIQRSKGRSATGAAAYRSGSKIVDARTGIAHDFSRKTGVLSSELLLPAGVPVLGRETIWNTAEHAEKRKDAAVAREFLISLPHELDAIARRDLAMKFARLLVETYGVCAECSVHAPSRAGDERNHHAHVLTTVRAMAVDGSLGERVAVFASAKTGSDETIKLRQIWEQMVNDSLKGSGHRERVSALPIAKQRAALEQNAQESFSAIERLEISAQIATLDHRPEPKLRPRRRAQNSASKISEPIQTTQERTVWNIRRARYLRAQYHTALTEIHQARIDVRKARFVEMVTDPEFVGQLATRLKLTVRRLTNAGRKIDCEMIRSALRRINSWLGRNAGYRLNTDTVARLEAECISEHRKSTGGFAHQRFPSIPARCIQKGALSNGAKPIRPRRNEGRDR